MRVTVFGANGKIGTIVVDTLLRQGHQVVAFVHGNVPPKMHKQLQTVHGDIYNQADVAKALTGSQAVISALGSWGTPKKDILSTGMRHIIHVMEKQGVRRIVSLTGHDARMANDDISTLHILSRAALMLVAPQVLRDGEEHIRLLASSGLEWTVLRSPIMTNSEDRDYKLVQKRPKPWATIPRQAVAYAMVDQLQKAADKTSPFVIRG